MTKKQTRPGHTIEWWEGYDCQYPKDRNPYKNYPDLAEKSKNWLEGWLCRYYGEKP